MLSFACIFHKLIFFTCVVGIYSTTFAFKSPSACNMFSIVFNFFIGLTGAIVTLILRSIHGVQVLQGTKGNLLLYAQLIEWVLRYVQG
jgi:hypothetical protein